MKKERKGRKDRNGKIKIQNVIHVGDIKPGKNVEKRHKNYHVDHEKLVEEL